MDPSVQPRVRPRMDSRMCKVDLNLDCYRVALCNKDNMLEDSLGRPTWINRVHHIQCLRVHHWWGPHSIVSKQGLTLLARPRNHHSVESWDSLLASKLLSLAPFHFSSLFSLQHRVD